MYAIVFVDDISIVFTGSLGNLETFLIHIPMRMRVGGSLGTTGFGSLRTAQFGSLRTALESSSSASSADLFWHYFVKVCFVFSSLYPQVRASLRWQELNRCLLRESATS